MGPVSEGPPAPPRKRGADTAIGIGLGLATPLLVIFLVSATFRVSETGLDESLWTLVLALPWVTFLACLIAVPVIAVRTGHRALIPAYFTTLGVLVLVFLVGCFALIASLSG